MKRHTFSFQFSVFNFQSFQQNTARFLMMAAVWLMVGIQPGLVMYGQGQQLPPPDAPKSATFPPVVSQTLKNGLRVFVVEEHTTPVVSIRLMVPGGAGTEGIPAGLAGFTARLLDQGTESRSAKDIAQSIDFVGGYLGAGADYDATRISSTVLTPHTQLAFDLVSDLAQHAAFKSEEIERQRDQAIGDLQVNYAEPAYIADVAFRRVVMGNTPLGFPLDGTSETIKHFTREQIVEFYRKNYVPNGSFLVIGGDIKPQDAFAQAEKAFGNWKPGNVTPPGKITPSSQKSKLRVVVIDKPGAAQTEVRIGDTGIPRRDPEYFAGLVMNSILGDGYSARLNREIRIKRGLSYGAYSLLDTGRWTGIFQAGCATKTDSTKEAVEVILNEIKRMRNEVTPAEELTTRKAVQTGSFVQGLQTVGALVGQVSNTILYGLDLKTLNQYTKNVNDVTGAQVQAFSKKKLNTDTPTIVLVGDSKVFGEGIKKTYGEFTLIKLSEFDPLRPNLIK